MKRLLQMIAGQPWAVEPTKARAILAMLAERYEHGPRAAAEIEARLGGRKERKVAEAPGNIAVIALHGVIHNRARMVTDVSAPGGASAEILDAQIRAAMGSDDVKAVVLDVDSPGGAAAGTPELANTIRSLRGGDKPIVAQVNDLAASAAYWIASATDEIVATPSSQIGSVGVIAVHEQIAGMLEAEGIVETIISAGEYKAEGNPFEPLSDEARANIQQSVDQYYTMFLNAVAEGRGVSVATVKSDFGQGRVKIADEARKAGMIDRIGTMRETLERLGARFGGERERTGAQRARSVALETRRLQLHRHLAN